MKNKFLNVIIVFLVIAILGLLGYFVYDNYFKEEFSTDPVPDINYSYKVEDYITIEKVNLFNTDKIDVEKVVFKNLDVSIVNSFIDEQNGLIKMVENIYNYWASINFEGIKDTKIAYSDIWYQMNGNILTIYYDMRSADEIGECNDIAVINIDLENKKLVTDEELLRLGNSSFEKIADEHYNGTLEWLKTCDSTHGNCGIHDKAVNTIRTNQFEKDKDIYVDMIVDGLDGAIDCYIKDGKIKYDYSRYAIDALYQNVGKGGCFDYITVEVGDYK